MRDWQGLEPHQTTAPSAVTAMMLQPKTPKKGVWELIHGLDPLAKRAGDAGGADDDLSCQSVVFLLAPTSEIMCTSANLVYGGWPQWVTGRRP